MCIITYKNKVLFEKNDDRKRTDDFESELYSDELGTLIRKS